MSREPRQDVIAHRQRRVPGGDQPIQVSIDALIVPGKQRERDVRRITQGETCTVQKRRFLDVLADDFGNDHGRTQSKRASQLADCSSVSPFMKLCSNSARIGRSNRARC